MLRQANSFSSIPAAWAGITVLITGLLWLLTDPFTQNPLYHDFADQRTLLGIPHALNVLSNITFCLVGVWGIALTRNNLEIDTKLIRVYRFLFTGILLTGLGSAYYHWAPDNATLVWDSLPMTLGFMAFTSAVLMERYSWRSGYALLFPLLLLGIASVVYWHWSGDLRLYIAVQFGPILLLPLIIWKYPGPGTKWLWLTLAFYTTAKVLEIVDQPVFLASDGMVSGHTLKHLAAAFAALMLAIKFSKHVPGQARTPGKRGTAAGDPRPETKSASKFPGT